MPITSLDGVIAGARQPQTLMKAGIAMAAAGAMRGYTPWYAAGVPGAGAAPASGVNGAAVVAPVAGQIPRSNPGAGLQAYLSRLAISASQPGVLWLIDRLWANSGLSPTLTTAQAITPAALPPRDRDGTSNGNDVLAGIEWSATGGAGTPTVTLTYTDQDGDPGNSAALGGVTTPPVGTFELFPLAAGDTGIRAPTSFIQSATRTSGAFHLVLFRPLAQLEVTAANVGNAIDALTGGMPRIYDDSVLQLLWFPSSAVAVNFTGQYVETQG